MVSIPEDIILDILVRLPVKSIGRSRCVSKAWRKLSKDRKFVKMHHKLHNEMNEFNIMHHTVGGFTEVCTMAYDPSSSTCSDPVSVKWPLDAYIGMGFWGSSNGLVCLTCCDAREINAPHIVVIWNPCTNEYKKLPVSPSEKSIHRLSPTVSLGLTQIRYGFIYDYVTEDFKVVSLGIYNDKFLCEIHVYTLRSNSWRRLEDIPYDLCYHYGAPELARVPVNGALHWKASRKSMGQVTTFILSFNMEKERFEEIQMPANMFGFQTTLTVLKESLCLLSYKRTLLVEVWELKDYGVKDSWSRLFTIDTEKLFGHGSRSMPLRFFENGEILLGIDMDGAINVVLYDPENETTRTLQVYDAWSRTMVSFTYFHSVYKESLVSPNSGTYLRQANIEDEEQDTE